MLNTKADYKNIEKEIYQRILKRNNEIEKVNKEIEDQKAIVENARNNKAAALQRGTKEEFLKACELLSREENTLEYIEERARQIKATNRISLEELKKERRSIKEEQDRITREGTKKIISLFEELKSLRLEIMKDQNRGISIYKEMFDVFMEEATPEERKIISSNPDLVMDHYSMSYGINQVGQLETVIRQFDNALNNPGIKDFISK